MLALNTLRAIPLNVIPFAGTHYFFDTRHGSIWRYSSRITLSSTTTFCTYMQKNIFHGPSKPTNHLYRSGGVVSPSFILYFLRLPRVSFDIGVASVKFPFAVNSVSFPKGAKRPRQLLAVLVGFEVAIRQPQPHTGVRFPIRKVGNLESERGVKAISRVDLIDLSLRRLLFSAQALPRLIEFSITANQLSIKVEGIPLMYDVLSHQP